MERIKFVGENAVKVDDGVWRSIIMIKIFRGIHRSIIIEFDKMGNSDILKMFNELYEGKEYKLRVEFDMGLIQKKKRDERENLILICKQDNEVDSVFKT